VQVLVFYPLLSIIQFYVVYRRALLLLFKIQVVVRHLSEYENASKLIPRITVASALLGNLEPLTEKNQSVNSEVFSAVSSLMQLIKKT
jgi:hypothetical protein